MAKKKQNIPSTLIVGIDAAHGKADAAIVSAPHQTDLKLQWRRKRYSFKYTTDEADKLLETIRKFKTKDTSKVIIAMEVTGVYHENICNYLIEHTSDDENVILLDPKYVNRWCQLHQKSKSDPLDAQSIATIVATERDYKTVQPAKQGKEKGYSDLKASTHRQAQLKKLINQEMNRLQGLLAMYFPEASEILGKGAAFLAVVSKYPSCNDIMHALKQEVYEVAYEASKHHFKMDTVDELYKSCEHSLATVPGDAQKQVIRDIVETIQLFKKQLKELEKQIQKQASELPGYELLVSIVGCGSCTAAASLAEIGDIARFPNADKLVSYVGIDPVNKRSGSSVDVLGRISKKGSKYLRHSIFSVAEMARRHNPVLKQLFDRVKGGKKNRHKAAVVAVANKVARYIYSVLKHGKEFVISFKDLQALPEDTRNSFFQNITTDIPKDSRRAIYKMEEADGNVVSFVYCKAEPVGAAV